MSGCSFGDYETCGSLQSTKQQQSESVPLANLTKDMTEWLKDKYGGSGASGTRGRPKSGEASMTSKNLLITQIIVMIMTTKQD